MDKFSTQDLELDQSKRAMACYFSVGSDKFCKVILVLEIHCI